MPTIDYEEIFEKAEVGIALNDPEAGTVGIVNDRYAELMGYDREELREMTIDEISAEDPSFDQQAAMEKIEKAIAGERQQFDWLFERRDGTQFWGEVVLKRTSIGPSDRLLAFVRDISDRKQYESELERKNRRLDEFASIVSHDLRNPLGVARGRLELAREEYDSDDLATVARAHERMNTLIGDLLTFARSGEDVGEFEPVELAALAETCWQNVETAEATLRIRADRTILADRSRVQQLLENLLRNAVEHCDEPVSVVIDDLETGFLVADDGPGIPPDQRDRVFEPGYSTRSEGTGFGLKIAKEIAEAHDWTIDIAASESDGTQFEITGAEFAK